MNKDIISKFATAAMILTSDAEGVERDTLRTIIAEEEYKESGSYEQIAQIVEECSMVSKLDLLNFWEQVAFGWVVGLQMGYDNFALYAPHKGLYALSPIFTFEMEESLGKLSLSLNRKCKKLTRNDFEVAMKKSGIRAKIINTMFGRFAEALPKWCDTIDSSELSEESKSQYKEFLRKQVAAITPPP